jgi:hypothetical protein
LRGFCVIAGRSPAAGAESDALRQPAEFTLALQLHGPAKSDIRSEGCRPSTATPRRACRPRPAHRSHDGSAISPIQGQENQARFRTSNATNTTTRDFTSAWCQRGVRCPHADRGPLVASDVVFHSRSCAWNRRFMRPSAACRRPHIRCPTSWAATRPIARASKARRRSACQCVRGRPSMLDLSRSR